MCDTNHKLYPYCLSYQDFRLVKETRMTETEREGERENMISILRLPQQGEDVEAEAGTLRRLAAGNRWSGGERKHDQDVQLCKDKQRRCREC